MIAYLGLIILLIIGNQLINEKKGKVVYTTLLLILFMGLRNPLSSGSDTIGYYRLFTEIGSMDLSEIIESSRMEHGFLIYMKACAMFIKNAQWFFVLSATFMFIPLGIVIYRYSTSVLQSALMFVGFSFFSFYTTGFRQTLAISICFLAFLCIENRKCFKFILLVLLAMTFHKSAIVFLPAYWISRLKSNNFNLSIYALSGTVLVGAMPIFATWFNEYGDYDYVVQSTSGGIPTFLCIVMVTVLMYCERYNLVVDKSTNLKLYNFQFVTIIFWIARFNNIMAERLSLYYFVYIIILLPNIYSSLKLNSNRRVCFGIICIVMIIFLYKLVGGTDLTFQTYEFFWQ